MLETLIFLIARGATKKLFNSLSHIAPFTISIRDG
jgi:hypothetical protein